MPQPLRRLRANRVHVLPFDQQLTGRRIVPLCSCAFAKTASMNLVTPPPPTR